MTKGKKGRVREKSGKRNKEGDGEGGREKERAVGGRARKAPETDGACLPLHRRGWARERGTATPGASPEKWSFSLCPWSLSLDSARLGVRAGRLLHTASFSLETFSSWCYHRRTPARGTCKWWWRNGAWSAKAKRLSYVHTCVRGCVRTCVRECIRPAGEESSRGACSLKPTFPQSRWSPTIPARYGPRK